MKKEREVIGLTGTNGAGKGEVALYFIKKGYTYFSLSDLIREELKKKCQEESRDNLIKTGNKLRERFGADVLARRVMKRIRGKAVVDSIRNPKEVEYLREKGEFILLAIDAPLELRYKRVMKRGRAESATTIQKFAEKEREEVTDSEKGQQLGNCMKMADFRIDNDGSLKELHQKLEKLL